MSYIWVLEALFAQSIVVLYPGVLIFWLVMHTHIERWRKAGKKAYWIASAGWPVTMAPLIYFHRDVFPPEWRMPSAPIFFAGVFVLLLAFLLGWQARHCISLRTLVGLPELEPRRNKQSLIKAGIYSKTRNPVYLTHWLLILSAAAMTGFAANWALFVLDSIVLPFMIRAEERELLARYGAEFTVYMRRVPRFFPRLTW